MYLIVYLVNPDSVVDLSKLSHQPEHSNLPDVRHVARQGRVELLYFEQHIVYLGTQLEGGVRMMPQIRFSLSYVLG